MHVTVMKLFKPQQLVRGSGVLAGGGKRVGKELRDAVRRHGRPSREELTLGQPEQQKNSGAIH